jgi:hypothetical protein
VLVTLVEMATGATTGDATGGRTGAVTGFGRGAETGAGTGLLVQSTMGAITTLHVSGLQAPQMEGNSEPPTSEQAPCSPLVA